MPDKRMAAVVTMTENLSKVKLEKRNFSNQNLRERNLSHSVFDCCNFDGADMTDANCEGSTFSGSTFRDTICYRTNFRNAKLAGTIFQPRDAYGMTVSLSCDTFRNMRVGQLWWYAWLVFATQMEPASEPVKGDIKGALIAAIGAERYVKLAKLFQRREI